MNTAVINIKTEAETKRKAQEFAREIGVSLSALLNAYLKQIVRTKRVAFNLDEEPSDYLLSVIKQAKVNRKQDKGSPIFDNAKDAVSWLNKQGV